MSTPAEKAMRAIEVDVTRTAKKPALGGPAKQSPAEALASIKHQLEQDADAEKEAGNAHFKVGNYKGAIESYSNAILMNRQSSVLHGNRAMAYLKLQAWSEAENDCTTALSFDNKFVKAYARRAHARLQQKKISAALADFEAVLRLEPGNKEAQEELKKLRQSATAAASATRAVTLVPTQSSDLSVQKVAAVPESAPLPAIASAATFVPTSAVVGVKATPLPANSSATSFPVPTRPQQPSASLSAIPPTASAPAQASPAALQPLFPSNPKQKPRVVELPDNAPRPKQVTSSSAAAPLVTLHRVIVTPTVPTEAPASAFEFEKVWHALQAHPELFARYLKLIPPSSFQHLFNLSLTPDAFNSIVIAASKHFEGAEKDAFAVLQALLQVPRIGVLIGFMDASETIAVGEVLRSVEGIVSAPDLAAVRMGWLGTSIQ